MKTKHVKNQIIVIDDSHDIGRLMLHCLQERDDSNILYFQDSVSALDFLSFNNFEGNKWLIVDIMMPKINGLELIVRAKEIDPSFNICVLTNNHDEKTINDAFRLGICEYIFKDRSRDEIIYKVNSLIDNEIEQTPEYIELYEVSEVINSYKVKNRIGKKLILETKEELPLHSLVNIPDPKGRGHLYRVEKCDLIDHGALITCKGVKSA
ncbi:response regulator [Bacteriovorax sp. DB6_IX]|uniref:response regulator n=1 Tax=Bacteriovorax sp. DB6_IX TaxID=1353530 RepID=UPI0009DB8EE4|nr:response regulator [Bacteriovorax sp. DB6_IX]